MTYLPIQLDQALAGDVVQAMLAASERAAEQTLRGFRQGLAVENKADAGAFDPVTEADRAAERVIREELLHRFPGYGFLGEETTRHDSVLQGADARCWVVDPIDGTRAYITGMPLWGTLIALNEAGEPTFGLLDQPWLGERFIGTPYGSVLRNRQGSQVLQCRQGPRLCDAIVQTTSPAMFDAAALQASFQRVSSQARLTRYGGDCYAYALLAMGFVDLVVECDLQPYDIQALEPIVRGAGGVICSWSGTSCAAGGSVVAAGSPALLEEVLPLLSEF